MRYCDRNKFLSMFTDFNSIPVYGWFWWNKCVNYYLYNLFSFFFSGQFGIPNNKRILDRRKGPIKKTAAVKKLPKLKTSNSADSILPEKSNSSKKKGERKVKSSDNSLAEGIKDINNNFYRPDKEKSKIWYFWISKYYFVVASFISTRETIVFIFIRVDPSNLFRLSNYITLQKESYFRFLRFTSNCPWMSDITSFPLKLQTRKFLENRTFFVVLILKGAILENYFGRH